MVTAGPLLSPLRYPGAKRKLASLIEQALVANGLRPKLYVEPFAGGAGVALQLLADGAVECIGLGEMDPLLSSFWHVLFFDTDWLADQIESIPVTLAQWREFKNGHLRTKRERALACLFLNRTSFSGIIAPSGGPLGGFSGSSDYPIDCRFPRERLVKRVRAIAEYRDKVAFVRCGPWQETVKDACEMNSDESALFFYMDPPFYNKADRLYTHYFRENDHVELCRALSKLDAPWLLSYDPADAIVQLYTRNGSRPKHIEVLYSAAGGGSQRREVLITNLQKMPVPPGYRTYTPKHMRGSPQQEARALASKTASTRRRLSV